MDTDLVKKVNIATREHDTDWIAKLFAPLSPEECASQLLPALDDQDTFLYLMALIKSMKHQRRIYQELVKKSADGFLFVMAKTEYVAIGQSVLNWIVSQKYCTDMETVLEQKSNEELLNFSKLLRDITYDIAIGGKLDNTLYRYGLGQE
jgi:hypothetical protein